jgi:hypothetical protein
VGEDPAPSVVLGIRNTPSQRKAAHIGWSMVARLTAAAPGWQTRPDEAIRQKETPGEGRGL